MLLLVKLSNPGWEKKFETAQELKRELFKYICKSCCEIWSEENRSELPDHSLTEDSLLTDLLNTDCGCEFLIDDSDYILTPLS